jgi:transposase
MAYIIKKKIKTNTYYYLVESKRVNGKSTFIWQKCIGTAEKIKKLYEKRDSAQKIRPQKVAYLEFGAVATFYALQKRLSLMDIFNKHCNKREQGCSVGEYLLVKILNRCIDPRAKYALDEWYQQTILHRLLGIPVKALSGQNFWNNTTYLDEKAIDNIENDLLKVFIEKFNLAPENLLFDESNFSVFFDATNPSGLAQHGHSKAKRYDLRQINLALLVTKEFGIPLKHHTYPGNINDKTEIKTLSRRIIETYKELNKVCNKLTLVFDKGNNQKGAIKEFDQEDIFFVGALKPSENKELLNIPLDKFNDLFLSEKKVYKVHTIKKILFGKERTVVVYYSAPLYKKQLYGLHKRIAKKERELQEFKFGKINQGRFKTYESCKKKIARMLKDKSIEKLFGYSLNGGEEGQLHFEYWIEDKEYKNRITQLGRNILFTSCPTLSTREIIEIYNGKNEVEDDFKKLKEDRSISTTPMFCWTDPKIIVHLFCCVMALMLIRLLQRELSLAKITMSPVQFIEQLKKIKEMHLFYPGTLKSERIISECNKKQFQLLKVFELEKYF